MSISRFCSTFRRFQFLSSTSSLHKNQRLLRTQGLRYHCLSNYTRLQKYDRRNFSSIGGIHEPEATSSTSSSSNIASWVLGMAATIVLPFLKFKNDVDNTVEIVEEIVEVVEKVAEVVDKLAEDISADLPAGGKIKKMTDIVEGAAEETVKDAHMVEDAIHKFQEVEESVERIVQILGNREAKESHMETKDG